MLTSEQGGRRQSDPVYHHAEVYGNKAELDTAQGTCWQRDPCSSSTGPGHERQVGTVPTAQTGDV